MYYIAKEWEGVKNVDDDDIINIISLCYSNRVGNMLWRGQAIIDNKSDRTNY